MDVEQEFRRILQNNRFGIIGKSHRSKCFKDFSDRYQEAMERALSCSRNVARERGPEEGGGDPREGGPGEDSTSEDGPACECVPVEGSGVGWFITVRQKNYKTFSFPGTMIGQGPGGDRGLKNKTKMHQKLSQRRLFECSSFYHFIEDLSHHFFCHVVAVLDVFSSDSVVVASFPFVEFVDC